MIAILHNIRSMYNVGAIFRTADAVGIKKIYLCGITPCPKDEFGNFRRQISKVALGAEKNINWEKISRTFPLLKKLKKEGYLIFSLEQDKKALPYYKVKLSSAKLDKVAILVGHEIKGLPKKILKFSDKILEIPMYGKKESLNVAVAFAILVFHLRHSN